MPYSELNLLISVFINLFIWRAEASSPLFVEFVEFFAIFIIYYIIIMFIYTVQEEILAREIFGEIARLKHLANFTLTQQSDLLPLVLLETN